MLTPKIPAVARSWRPQLLSCAAALAIVVVVGAAPAGATGSGRVTFGVGPANKAGAIGSRSSFSYGATPGAFLSDNLAVVNYSPTSLKLQVYSADAKETTSGSFGLSVKGQRNLGVGSWISIPAADATVTVPAEHGARPGEVVVPFTLRVPDSATPGDHVGGIVASLRTFGRSPSGENIILNQRVGARVFVLVSGKSPNSLHADLSVRDVHVIYSGTLNPFGRGTAIVNYDLVNSGDLDLSVTQHVVVHGLLDDSQVSFPTTEPLLLPGSDVHEAATLKGVWPQIVAQATVTANGTSPVGAQSVAEVSASGNAWTWAVPWTLLIIITLLALIATWSWRRRAS
jgi:hypothetical protein